MSHPDQRMSSLFAFIRESAAIRREYEAAQPPPCPRLCGWPVHAGVCRKFRPGDMEEANRPTSEPPERDEPDPEGVERRRRAVLEAKKAVSPWHKSGSVLLKWQLDEAVRRAEDGAPATDTRDHPDPGEECKWGCGKKVHQGKCKGAGWNRSPARREGPDWNRNKEKA